jgi:type II secretory pathway component PulM
MIPLCFPRDCEWCSELPAYSVATSLILFGLLVIWQPLAAQEQDVQAQLKELRDLLAQQQAVEALAQQPQAAPETSQEKYASVAVE